MAASLSGVSEELAEIEGQISDIFRALSNGFQKLEKIKDSNRQSRQLEELTDKMRESIAGPAKLPLHLAHFAKPSLHRPATLTAHMHMLLRLIKEFDRELKDLEYKNDPDTNKMLTEKKQSMIKELNSYVALKKQYASNLENKRVDLFEGPGEGFAEENVRLASGNQHPPSKSKKD
ncbi:hypothetical protein BUALT_Bualt05G0078900 [Buddleja alternifolia]|uniref:Uncharacterized protein n=1 Tax=Buddleja alternifolia TaxID=168488 RepID=A0AAV6XHL2_9LAMI|nr:hypothetical protein BUALT_Bualt05G0078900 [Buddleja alternifolia]